MSIRRAILAILSLAALALAAQQSAAASASSPAGSSQATSMKANVTRSGDGQAKVTFQPVGSKEKVQIYNANGEVIGEINWAASFEIVVSEKALRASTTTKGIDLHSLLSDFNPIKAGDKTLVAAELPKTTEPIVGNDGKVIQPGSEIYFGLDSIAKERTVEPVGAWGGKMGPGGAANNFNDRLMRNGVKDRAQKVAPTEKSLEKTQEKATEKTVEKPIEKPAAPIVQNAPKIKDGVHGEPNLPYDASVTDADLTFDSDMTGYFSSPTCSAQPGRLTQVTSNWGRRVPKETTNGNLSSSNHDGIDLRVSIGTPVVAAADGCIQMPKVDKRGLPTGSRPLTLNPYAGYGLSIRLDHRDGYDTQYGHLSRFSPAIAKFQKSARPGDRFCVKRGDVIGMSGMTGNCTGPHLHFGLHYKGKSLNPRRYMDPNLNQEISNSCSVLAKRNQARERQLAETDAKNKAGSDNRFVRAAKSARTAGMTSATVSK